MKLLSIIAILFFQITDVVGQIEIKILFKNTCDNSVTKLDFQLSDLNITRDNLLPDIQSVDGKAIVPKAGTYHLTSNFIWGDNMIGMFDQTIEIDEKLNQIDTIDIPKIKFTWDGVLHSKYWNYFNCMKLCDGNETDYYPNGQKRLEGEFVNGKPNRIIEYGLNGKKKVEFWYVPGTVSYKRVNWFDETGKLDEYDKYKIKKHKTIKTTYTSFGKRVGKDVIKHGTEK